MKKIIILFLSFIFFYGCSTNNDNNGNSTTAIIPLAPTNLAESILSNQIILTWLDNSTNETGFKIERKTGSGAWSEIGSVNTNIYTYTDASVNYGTTYTYRVYAFNSSGNSLNYSNEITITTLLSISTNAITNVSTSTVTSGGNISYGGGSSVTSRGVVWSTNPSPNISLPTKTFDGSGTSSFISSITRLFPNTTYYLRAYATNISGTAYGNEITFSTLPVLTTNDLSSIGTTSATSGGNISIGGGAPVTSRGVVWSLSPLPSIILSTKTSDGSGIGSFTSLITGLTPNTTYYLRAYATNISGTAYGNEITFTSAFPYSYTQGQTLTDIEGNTYSTINTNCNNKTWMQSNLNVSKFKNGDIIPQATSTSNFNSYSPAWCYFNNDPANGAIYGKLYNAAAALDPRGLAPSGWHISTTTDWGNLINCLGGSTIAADKLRSTGTQFWASPNVGATNSSGFTALPGGMRSNNGSFDDINGSAHFWSPESSPVLSFLIDNQYCVALPVYSDTFYGLSVRCVKD